MPDNPAPGGQERPARNRHLSVSRAAKWEQCPRRYAKRYVEHLPDLAGEPARLGAAVHDALEWLYAEHVQAQRTAALSTPSASRHWALACRKHGLTGLEPFRSGKDMLARYAKRQGDVDHARILAVERTFETRFGGVLVVGRIDRVDRIDAETIEVIDYKTGFVIQTQAELDHDLQLSIYHLAAKRLWPWAKKIVLSLEYLRIGIRVATTRSPVDDRATLGYIEAAHEAMETATEFPARFGGHCGFCSYRRSCPAYLEAMTCLGDPPSSNDSRSLEGLSLERIRVAAVAKVATSRKKELDAALRAHIHTDGEILAGGMRYRMLNAKRRAYPFTETVALLAAATGMTPEAVAAHVATIDAKALDALLKALRKRLGTSPGLLLRARAEGLCEVTYSPRLLATEAR